MKLNLGGQETIDDPSPEQVAHYLQYMPAESPFIVLDRGEGEFIQAIIEDGRYRVEYKEGETQWFVAVEYEKAVSIFEAYFCGTHDISEMASWKKLRELNPTATRWIAVGLTVLCLSLLGLGLWLEIDKWLEIYR